jgi:hypothetical protein
MYLEFTTVITFQSTQKNKFTFCMCECVGARVRWNLEGSAWMVAFPKPSGSRSHMSLYNHKYTDFFLSYLAWFYTLIPGS